MSERFKPYKVIRENENNVRRVGIPVMSLLLGMTT